MRIGLFTDTYYPRLNGVATSVRALKDNLEMLGHDVFVVTTTDPKASPYEHNVIRIPSVSCKTQRLGIFISPHAYCAIRNLSLDIVHTHSEFFIGRLGHIVSKRLNIPLVHTMHTIYEYYTDYIISSEFLKPIMQSLARKMTAAFCNYADMVIAPSKKTYDLISSYGVESDIRVIPTGIKLEKFGETNCDMERVSQIRSSLGIAPDDSVLIYIGRVAYEKNLDGLLVAVREYLISHSNVKLIIIGDGLARAGLEKLSELLHINSQVVFAGARPWEDINLYYRLGDVFVGSSRSETQGLTYIEAMASGLPVVAKRDSCLDGVLLGGENGYDFNSSMELSAALDRLLNSREELNRYSQAAFKSVQNLSSREYARQVNEAYKEITEVYTPIHSTHKTAKADL